MGDRNNEEFVIKQKRLTQFNELAFYKIQDLFISFLLSDDPNIQSS